MKRTIISLFMAMVSFLSLAQNLDSINQNRYWVYKDRFLKYFTHVGGHDRGESLPMDVIVRNLDCKDVVGDRIQSGDVMAAMGMYLAALATEYELLSQTDDYDKLVACRNELYYAIRAIDQVDQFAEGYYPGQNTTDTKGFLVRDNIPITYYQYWEETDNMPFHSSHATNGFVVDTFITPTADVLHPGTSEVWLSAGTTYPMKATDNPNRQDTPYNGLAAYGTGWSSIGVYCGPVRSDTTNVSLEVRRSNEMSQDHALGLLMGLKFVQKFINDENCYIQPTAQDSGMWVMAETRLIAERIMNHMSQKLGAREFKFNIDDPGPLLPDTIIMNIDSARYIILNPVLDNFVDRGWEAFFLSGGYEKLGEDLTRKDYPAGYVKVKNWKADYDNWFAKHIATPLVKLAFSGLFDYLSDSAEYQKYWRDRWNNTPTWIKTVEGVPYQSDVQYNMIMRLAASTNSWTHTEFAEMAENRNFPWFELMYACLNDSTPKLSKSYYDNLLNQAHCDGVSKFNSFWVYDTTSLFGQIISIDSTLMGEHHPFNRSDVFSLPNRSRASGAWVNGDFNGLDYMLMHNMYRICFAQSMNTPIDPQGCPCSSTVAEMFDDTWTNGLKDTVTSIARFPEYRDAGIRIPEYISHDLRLDVNGQKGGHIRPTGDLTICGAHVRLYSTSSIRVPGSDKSTPKELRIGRGGILDLGQSSSLIIDTFSKVIVEPGGILRLRSGANLIIDKGGVLEIFGTLELMEDAELSVTPGTFGQGYIRFKNNGAGSAKYQAKIVTEDAATINIDGPYQGHKTLEIDGTAPMVIPETVSTTLTDGLVELGQGCVLKVLGPLTTDYMKFDAKDTTKRYNHGLLTIGQYGVRVKNTEFAHGVNGVTCHNYISNQQSPVFEQVSGTGMEVVVFNQGMGMTLQGEFDDCGDAIYLVKPSIPTTINDTRFENGGTGVTYDAQSTGSLRFRYGTFKANNAGVYARNGTVLLQCSNFDENYDGIMLEYNPLVSINENQKAGGNIFKNSLTNVITDGLGGYQLDLTNGHSRFESNSNLFEGYLKSHNALTPPVAPATQYKLQTSYNFWDFYPPYQYNLKYYIGNQGKLNAATVTLDHTSPYLTEDSLLIKQSDLCPSYGTGNGQFTTKGAGARFIDANNQSVTNSYYSGSTLGDVFEDINDRMYYQEDYLPAYYRAKSIMDYSLGTLSKFDEYVVHKLYRSLLESYGQILFDTALLIDKAGLTTELLGTLDDLESRGHNSLDSFWVSQNLMVNMDIAEVYRMNNNRNTALMVLATARAGLTEIEDIHNIDNFICVIEAEQDVLNGVKTAAELAVMDCYQSGTSPAYPLDESEGQENNKTKPFVDWSPQPNPAETGVEVVFNLKTRRFVEIEVYDILGHKLASKERARYKKGSNSVFFDVGDWPTGMYFVKFNYDGFSDSKQLLIQRD